MQRGRTQGPQRTIGTARPWYRRPSRWQGPAQPPIGLKLGQHKAKRTFSSAFASACYSHFLRYSLGHPAPGVRVVDARPSVVGMIAEEGEDHFHNNSSFFYKCNY